MNTYLDVEVVIIKLIIIIVARVIITITEGMKFIKKVNYIIKKAQGFPP